MTAGDSEFAAGFKNVNCMKINLTDSALDIPLQLWRKCLRGF